MASCRPGIGDPLASSTSENPYPDGKPCWQLQTKHRTCGPRENLATGLSVRGPLESPYAHAFPEMYRVDSASKEDGRMIGRRHYGHHLRRTEADERRDRGLAVPDDRPYGLGGKAKVDIQAKVDPNDGGVWEPVRRQYPKPQETERGRGCRIVQKPVPLNPVINLRYVLSSGYEDDHRT